MRDLTIYGERIIFLWVPAAVLLLVSCSPQRQSTVWGGAVPLILVGTRQCVHLLP